MNLSGIGNANGATGTAVPNVVGMTTAAATAALTQAGLTLGTVSTGYSSSEPAGVAFGESPQAGMPVNLGSAVNLMISTGEAPAPPPNPLTFENNYMVTGDYAAAGVSLHTSTPGTGVASGTITMPDLTSCGCGQGIPDGADIVDGFLYWTTLETTASPSGGNGTFLGYPIAGAQIGVDQPNYNDGSNTGTLREYRADVNDYFQTQLNWNGERLGSGPFAVSLPDTAGTGGGFVITEGATLVEIYRALSPNVPLKSVIIYDGSALPTTSTTQTVQGFYDSAGTFANLTTLGEAGASYVIGNSSVPLAAHSAQYSATLNANNAYTALIFSTAVTNSDNDGILDAWKAGPAAGSFFAGQPGYVDVKTQSWVALPGAKHGEKDLFVQFDYMCGNVFTSGTLAGTCDPTQENLYPAADVNGNDPLAMVTQAFANTGVTLHLVPGNAVQENECTDVAGQPLCEFPGQPGVISWKDTLELSKQWPRNFASCAAGGDCTARFPLGQKDSYHYVLFGHSLAIPAWNTRFQSLISIAANNATGLTTVVTTSRGPQTLPNGVANIYYCPSRFTISGVIGNSNVNGTYNTSSCPDSQTIILTTPGIPTWSYPNTTLPEPDLGLASGTVTSISGYSDLGGADSAVTLALWETDPQQNMATRAQVIAGTMFHEIGHTLGLTHGGLYYLGGAGSYVPTFDINCKPNYQSSMNYLFQLSGVGPNNAVAYSNQTLETLTETSLGLVGNLVDTSSNLATFSTSAWYQSTEPTNSTESPATLHCDGSPLNTGETGYFVPGTVDPVNPAWLANQNITFDGVEPGSTGLPGLVGYNDVANIDLRQVGATGGELASLASVLNFGSSSTPLPIDTGGTTTLGAGGAVTLGANGSLSLVNGGSVTVGSGAQVSGGGTIMFNTAGSATLSASGTVTPPAGGTITLASGDLVTITSQGVFTLASGGTVTLGGGGTVTLGGGGTVTLGGGKTVTIPAAGGTYVIPGGVGGGGTVTLGGGGTVTLGGGGTVTLGGGGTVTLGGGGTVTLGGGGTVTLGAGGTVTLGGGGVGTVTLGGGGTVTLGAGGTVTLGGGGTVTLGGGGTVTLGGGGTVTLGGGKTAGPSAGGTVTLGAGGTVTLGAGGTVTLGGGGTVTLGGGGTVTLGGGGTVTLGGGGTVTLGGGGTSTITVGGVIVGTCSGSCSIPSGGTVTLGGGGTVTLGGGGTVTLGGGGTVTLGGGGTVTLGGGGVVTLGAGGVGTVTLGGGGVGTVTLGGGGVGTVTLGGGGAVTNELDYNTANSVVRPPSAPTYSVTPAAGSTPESVQVNWNAPIFGVVQTYTISRSVIVPPSTSPSTPVVIGSVSGVFSGGGYTPPATTFTDTNPPTGTLIYTITTTLVPDTVGSTPRQSVQSPPAVITLGQNIVLGPLPSSVVLSNTQATTITVTATAISNNAPNMQLVSFTASGPCSAGNSTVNSGTGVSSAIVTLNSTGSCTITALQAGNSTTVVAPATGYSAATPVSGTFAILPQGSNIQSQIITFGSTPSAQYGGSFSVSASSTSHLPVSFTPSGPCTVAATTGTATGKATGAGLCKITATALAGTNSGNSYSTASVSQSFAIATAPLTVTANPITLVLGQAIPPLTYTFGPLVNGDSLATAVSGTPALATTATSLSGAGTYPIVVSTGTLAAANYSFVFVPGVLTIMPATTSTSLASSTGGTSNYGQLVTFTPTVTAAVAPPGTDTVIYSYSNPTINSGASVTLGSVPLNGGGYSTFLMPPGTNTVTATFDGDNSDPNYQSSSATVKLVVASVPVAYIDPASATFPNTDVGSTSASITVILTNIGTATLNISSVQLQTGSAGTSDFVIQSSTCGSTLPPGPAPLGPPAVIWGYAAPPPSRPTSGPSGTVTVDSSCIVTLAFAPKASQYIGPRTGTLVFTDNDGGQAGATDYIELSGSALSAISGQFPMPPTQSIAAGDYIWFNSEMSIQGPLDPYGNPLNMNADEVQVMVTNGSISFTNPANNATTTIPVPDALIQFVPGLTQASTTFDATNNRWVTQVPMADPASGRSQFVMPGNIFMTAVPYLVPAKITTATGWNAPQNVTWSAEFTTDTPGVSLGWQWGAAVYNSCFGNQPTGSNPTCAGDSLNLANLGVLGVNSADPGKCPIAHLNGYDAGTPYSYIDDLIVNGAPGPKSGPPNLYTGNPSQMAGVVPAVTPVTFSPSPMVFMPVNAGQSSSPMTLTITNTNQSLPLNISGIALAGSNTGDFAITATTCSSSKGATSITANSAGALTLAAVSAGSASSCTFTIVFTPKDLGTRTSSLIFTYATPAGMAPNETPPPQSVDLYGTGAGGSNPIVGLSAVSLNFGNQERGTTSASQTVTVVNAGGGPMTINSIAASSEFGETNTCPAPTSTLASGASCTISVWFQPLATVTGTLTGSITITDNNTGVSGSTQTISLTGKSLP
ncbi:MAG TPA: choice-of-anchor D domain-containing protein [Terracidiphilus sp.]|nr:choice-of-anchor D domain-containing protein [Terracidiphilus sp.]